MVISLQRAVEGHNLHMAAEGFSTHTIRDYNTTFRRFMEFVTPGTPMGEIAPDDIREFLAYWQGITVKPRGAAPRPARVLGAKSIKNMHTALSALWTWAVGEGYVKRHIIQGVIKSPRATPPPIDPLTEEQISAVIDAINGRHWITQTGKHANAATPTADRNRAIVLFMLDTGCRASEVCGLLMADLDLKQQQAMVLGKGNKRRMVAFGPKTGRAMFRYLSDRPDPLPDDPVFLGRDGGQLTRSGMLAMVRRAGRRAGIANLYPHRLRHTFAINYLRYGGDIYTLQQQLGHSSLDMVKRYLKIAGADVKRVHRRASPVENML